MRVQIPLEATFSTKLSLDSVRISCSIFLALFASEQDHRGKYLTYKSDRINSHPDPNQVGFKKSNSVNESHDESASKSIHYFVQVFFLFSRKIRG